MKDTPLRQWEVTQDRSAKQSAEVGCIGDAPVTVGDASSWGGQQARGSVQPWGDWSWAKSQGRDSDPRVQVALMYHPLAS